MENAGPGSRAGSGVPGCGKHYNPPSVTAKKISWTVLRMYLSKLIAYRKGANGLVVKENAIRGMHWSEVWSDLYWRRILRLGLAWAKKGSSSDNPSVYKYGQTDGSSVDEKSRIVCLTRRTITIAWVDGWSVCLPGVCLPVAGFYYYLQIEIVFIMLKTLWYYPVNLLVFSLRFLHNLPQVSHPAEVKLICLSPFCDWNCETKLSQSKYVLMQHKI